MLSKKCIYALSLLLLAAVSLNLGGCATPGNLSTAGAYASGYGSFSLTMATNTNYVVKYYLEDADYSVLQVESVDNPGTIYNIDLGWYPVVGVRQAYGYLPAGRYRISKISASVVNTISVSGSAGTTGYVQFNNSIPSFQVEPNVHTDLGMLVVEGNPATANRTYVGWMPSDNDAITVIKARVKEHTPVPKIRTSSLARKNGADKWIVAQAFENPAPSGELHLYPNGEIVIPCHLGRILYRDTNKHWHVLVTGHTTFVRDVGILDDDRIAAMLSNGRIMLSDVTHEHWRQLSWPPQLDAADRLGVLVGGRIAVGGRAFWNEPGPNGTPVKQAGRAIYMIDAKLGKWKLVERLAGADEIAFDSENVYLYTYVNARRLLRDSKLMVTNVVSGMTEVRTNPAELLQSFGDGLMTAYDDPDDPNLGAFWDREQFVSRDAGKTWHRIESNSDSGGKLTLAGPMYPLPNRSSAISFGSYYNPTNNTYHRGYFETNDGGSSWKMVFGRERECALPAEVTLIHGALWETCDEGIVLKYDPAMDTVTTERATSRAIP